MVDADPAIPRAAVPHASLPPGADAACAVEVYHGDGRAPVLLVCDHAGRRVPTALANLGLPESELARHIGFDPGAAEVTYGLARLLDAPAVLNHVSRLVIDPNRRPGAPDSIPTASDGTIVPGNQNLTPDEVRARLRLAFVPYHRAIARRLARLRRRVEAPALVSVHSFTPVMRGVFRPWDVAVLWDRDPRLALPALAALRTDPALRVGDNEPYSGRYPAGYSIPFHAARTGLPHVTFEIRQDLLATRAEALDWARRLFAALRKPLADRCLYRHLQEQDTRP